MPQRWGVTLFFGLPGIFGVLPPTDRARSRPAASPQLRQLVPRHRAYAWSSQPVKAGSMTMFPSSAGSRIALTPDRWDFPSHRWPTLKRTTRERLTPTAARRIGVSSPTLYEAWQGLSVFVLPPWLRRRRRHRLCGRLELAPGLRVVRAWLWISHRVSSPAVYLHMR